MEKKVKDVMIPVGRCPTIPVGSSVKEAVALLGRALEAGPCAAGASALVIDNNTPVGVLGMREILQAVAPVAFKGGTYRGWTVPADWSAPVFLKGIFTDKCQRLSSIIVGEVMAPVTMTLNAGDPLSKAAHVLVAGGYPVVPVWQEGKVVGMVGYTELFAEVTAILSGSEPGADSGRKQVAG